MRDANRLQLSRPATHFRVDAGVVQRLRRGRDYLATHLAEGANLERAAAEAGYSPYYFLRLFAETFGETPHEFLTRQRLEHAKRLLLAGHHSVTDICLDLGYESLGSFSTRFRSLTGLSPAQFRKEACRLFGGWQKTSLYYVPACFLMRR